MIKALCTKKTKHCIPSYRSHMEGRTKTVTRDKTKLFTHQLTTPECILEVIPRNDKLSLQNQQRKRAEIRTESESFSSSNRTMWISIPFYKLHSKQGFAVVEVICSTMISKQNFSNELMLSMPQGSHHRKCVLSRYSHAQSSVHSSIPPDEFCFPFSHPWTLVVACNGRSFPPSLRESRNHMENVCALGLFSPAIQTNVQTSTRSMKNYMTVSQTSNVRAF